jgi:hypothetical protein
MTSAANHLNEGEIFARSEAIFAGCRLRSNAKRPFAAPFLPVFTPNTVARQIFLPWHTHC